MQYRFFAVLICCDDHMIHMIFCSITNLSYLLHTVFFFCFFVFTVFIDEYHLFLIMSMIGVGSAQLDFGQTKSQMTCKTLFYVSAHRGKSRKPGFITTTVIPIIFRWGQRFLSTQLTQRKPGFVELALYPSGMDCHKWFAMVSSVTDDDIVVSQPFCTNKGFKFVCAPFRLKYV